MGLGAAGGTHAAADSPTTKAMMVRFALST